MVRVAHGVKCRHLFLTLFTRNDARLILHGWTAENLSNSVLSAPGQSSPE